MEPTSAVVLILHLVLLEKHKEIEGIEIEILCAVILVLTCLLVWRSKTIFSNDFGGLERKCTPKVRWMPCYFMNMFRVHIFRFLQISLHRHP